MTTRLLNVPRAGPPYAADPAPHSSRQSSIGGVESQWTSAVALLPLRVRCERVS